MLDFSTTCLFLIVFVYISLCKQTVEFSIYLGKNVLMCRHIFRYSCTYINFIASVKLAYNVQSQLQIILAIFICTNSIKEKIKIGQSNLKHTLALIQLFFDEFILSKFGCWDWYFVTKIVLTLLTYCEKKIVLVLKKNI